MHVCIAFYQDRVKDYGNKYKKNVQSVFILRDKDICMWRLNLCLDSTGKIVYGL